MSGSETLADVRSESIGSADVPVLSPEFIAVCLFSYPTVHRSASLLDFLALNQAGCLQNSHYLSDLLMRTSLGKLIVAQDMLGLRTRVDLQALLDSIQRQLIGRFLYWNRVHVEALNLFQFFVLLDIGEEAFNLPSDTVQFMDAIIGETLLSGRNLTIAKLGLHFLTMGIPPEGLAVLESADLQTLIRRGLTQVSGNPDWWLARTKSILMTLRQLVSLENLVRLHFDILWKPASLTRIVQRVLFDDPSRLTLLSSVRAICHDLKTSQISSTECLELLTDLVAPPGD